MPAVQAHSAAVVGVEGHLVVVEADVTPGIPAMVLFGLPEAAVPEARDRIRVAILSSGEAWPGTKITVGLSPVTLPKRGGAFDLAIAVAILGANCALATSSLAGTMFLAELGLDGRLRPVPGVLPALLAGAAAGIRTAVVAATNDTEAKLVSGMQVVAADSLAEVVAWLRDGVCPLPASSRPGDEDSSHYAANRPERDLAEIRGMSEPRLALELCAAGGHSLSLVGPVGAGKTMLAERLPTILPRLDASAAVEVTSIHSVAGMLTSGSGLLTEPPFCAPHHTASKAAILGGGSGLIRPGAVSLAHRGVLFLDQAPEFPRDVLEALRQPMETGQVVIARQGMTVRFPARFILVLAANPCLCYGAAEADGTVCVCSPAMRRRYLGRVSGLLRDRVDIKVAVKPVNRDELLHDRRPAESSAAVAERVAAARERAAARLHGTPWQLNAEVPGAELRRSYLPSPSALRELERAVELAQLSVRSADRIVRVAWSVADLAGKSRPEADEVVFAIGLWLLGASW
jgi:magnesium chelatase family protein